MAMLADPVLSKSKEGELDTMEVESNAQLDQTRSCLDLAVANRWKLDPHQNRKKTANILILLILNRAETPESQTLQSPAVSPVCRPWQLWLQASPHFHSAVPCAPQAVYGSFHVPAGVL